MILKNKQKKAYELLCKGENVFLTGPAGTGKTSVIKMFMNAQSQYREIVITSTTGTSALLLGGTTLHSYLGIGYGNGSVESLVEKICGWGWLRKRWISLDCLIIDEISMLSPDLFDKLEEIARQIRHNEEPFGGIQIVLSGDFLQLPCVGVNSFCFESKSWNKCVKHTICLDEIIRQNDSQFQILLNNVRVGNITPEVKDMLNSRINIELKNSYGIKPTKIYATNNNVDRVNDEELDSLAIDGRQFFEYNMDIVVYSGVNNRIAAIEKFKKYCTAPETLQLCIDSQVMLLKNLDLKRGLANGSRGVVTSFSGEMPVVKFLNGEELVIDYNIWEVEENNKKILKARQIPLKVAYAITIHKCCSKDTIVCTEKGLKRIEKLFTDTIDDNQSYKTHNINIKIHGKNGINQATQIYKGGVEKTYKIRTLQGYTIEGSERHPILVRDGDNEIWKKLPEVKKGEYLVLKKGTKCFGSKEYTKPITDFNMTHIPSSVLEGSKNAQISFIKDVFYHLGNKYKEFAVLKLFSSIFTRELQILMLNVGVKSHLMFKNTLIIYEDYPVFCSLIDIQYFGKRKVIETDQLFIDIVCDIELGEDQLYDLYIPEDHTFIGNGIINHNSQGYSLDYAELDLSNVFEYGQAYVALSRVKSLEGMSIIDIDYEKIQAHPRAVEYYTDLV